MLKKNAAFHVFFPQKYQITVISFIPKSVCVCGKYNLNFNLYRRYSKPENVLSATSLSVQKKCLYHFVTLGKCVSERHRLALQEF